MKAKIIDIALGEYFTHEVSGPGHNPKVLEYFAESGNSWVKDDETAWCSAFANWVAKKAGYPISGSLLAKSWLDMGKPVENPEKGDFVIFSRGTPSSKEGHVSIFIKKDGDSIVCLGGNQGDEVNISRYPASRVLGYRDITLPAPARPKQLFSRTLSLGSLGDDVRTLQKLLKLTVDGSFGPETDKAVKAFQTAHRLVSDGIVGPITMAELSKIK